MPDARHKPENAATPRRDREDLMARRVGTEHEAWLGEVEGIGLTLTFLRQKREEAKRLAHIAPVDLGIPSSQPAMT
jgi:hypothetical protein